MMLDDKDSVEHQGEMRPHASCQGAQRLTDLELKVSLLEAESNRARLKRRHWTCAVIR